MKKAFYFQDLSDPGYVEEVPERRKSEEGFFISRTSLIQGMWSQQIKQFLNEETDYYSIYHLAVTRVKLLNV